MSNSLANWDQHFEVQAGSRLSGNLLSGRLGGAAGEPLRLDDCWGGTFDPAIGEFVFPDDFDNPLAHGSVRLWSDGRFHYTPQLGYVGPDQFCYRVLQGDAVSPWATVHVDVLAPEPRGPLPAAAPADRPDASVSRYQVHNVADVQPAPIQWLWPGRIPRGKVTIVAGPPAAGKSYLTAELAARVSRGAAGAAGGQGNAGNYADRNTEALPFRPISPKLAPNAPIFPDSPACAHQPPTEAPASHTEPSLTPNPRPLIPNVLLATSDDLAGQVRPRLAALGADLQQITAVVGEREPGSADLVQLPAPLSAIQDVLAESPAYDLIVIDGLRVDPLQSRAVSELRSLLAELARLAAATGAAVVLVWSGDPGPRGRRALAQLGQEPDVAVVWQVERDLVDPRLRRLTPVKWTLAAEPAGLGFELFEDRLYWETLPFEPYRPTGRSGPAPKARQAAARWLWEQVAASPRPVKYLQEEARAAGFSLITLRRAREDLGLESVREMCGGDKPCWCWTLPEAPELAPPLEPLPEYAPGGAGSGVGSRGFGKESESASVAASNGEVDQVDQVDQVAQVDQVDRVAEQDGTGQPALWPDDSAYLTASPADDDEDDEDDDDHFDDDDDDFDENDDDDDDDFDDDDEDDEDDDDDDDGYDRNGIGSLLPFDWNDPSLENLPPDALAVLAASLRNTVPDEDFLS
jgi:putative DNA primase/helicase